MLQTHSSTPAVTAVLAKIEEILGGPGSGPGHRLPPERTLAARLATSRATLREALRLLRALGIVEAAPRRGTRVVGVMPASLSLALPNLRRFANPADVMQARIILEPGIASLAAVCSLPGDWDGLAECIRGGKAARQVREFERWDREFHTRLVRLTRNEPLVYLSLLLQGVRDEATWGQMKERDLSHRGRAAEYLSDHRRILEAIRRRKPDEAQRHMREHLIRVRDNLMLTGA